MSVLFSPETKSGNVKVVAGEGVLDGTNPTVIETGLHSIVAVALTLRGIPTTLPATVLASDSTSVSPSASASPSIAAPGDSTKVLTYNTVGGTLNVYAWKTDGSDPTLVASGGQETFSYVAVGL